MGLLYLCRIVLVTIGSGLPANRSWLVDSPTNTPSAIAMGANKIAT